MELSRLRQARARREPDTAIGGFVTAVAAEARRAEKRLGSFVNLWEGLIPAELAARTRVVTLRGGVAHVTVDSSSSAYEIDRRLREGLEGRLRQAYGKTLVRVKVTVGRIP